MNIYAYFASNEMHYSIVIVITEWYFQQTLLRSMNILKKGERYTQNENKPVQSAEYEYRYAALCIM